MKNIMIRDLDRDQKKEIRDIVEEYMNRPAVSTTSASTAIEQMIRQFAFEEKRNREYRLGAEDDLRALRARVEELTIRLGDEVARRRNFTQALNDFTHGD